jgi:hypothetical protein
MNYIKNFQLFEYVSNITNVDYHYNQLLKDLEPYGVSVAQEKMGDIYYRKFGVLTKNKIPTKIIDKHVEKFKKSGFVLSYDYESTGLIDDNPPYNYSFYAKNINTLRYLPKKFLVHGTSPKLREKIEKEGIKTQKWVDSPEWNSEGNLKYPKSVFAATSYANRWMEYRNSDNWLIDHRRTDIKWQYDLNFNIFEHVPKYVMTFQDIPPDNIIRYKDNTSIVELYLRNAEKTEDDKRLTLSKYGTTLLIYHKKTGKVIFPEKEFWSKTLRDFNIVPDEFVELLREPLHRMIDKPIVKVQFSGL